MFNVRIKKYLDTEQIQIFSEELLSAGSEREDKRKVIFATGEIVPHNKSIIYTPFEDVPVVGQYIHNTDECIMRSVRRTKNKIYDLAKCNSWEWFVTFTFDSKKVDRYDFDECSNKMSQWLKNMGRLCNGMKYIIVPELHEDGAWHFHGLFANVDKMTFLDSGKRDKKLRTIYNVGKYRFGFTTATEVTDTNKACGYILKYMSKQAFQMTYNKKRYWASRNLTLPEVQDYLIENQLAFGRYMSKECIYDKKCDGYVSVRYIEVKKGASDFLLKTEVIEPSALDLIYTTNTP